MFNGDGPDEAMLGFRHNEKFFSDAVPTNSAMRSYFDLISYSTEEDRKRIMSPEFFPSTQGALPKFLSIIEPYSDLSPAEQAAAYELTSLLPGNNAVKGDRMGACWSIEGRAPFLDHRVSEIFARLPVNEKLKGGVGKYFLKRVAESYFDHDFVYRPKTMPTVPIGEWIKGPLYQWARDVLALPDGGRFNRSEVDRMLEDHRAGLQNFTKQLRTLLMTKLWLNEFFPSRA